MAMEDALFIRGRVNRLEKLAAENKLFEMGKKNRMFDVVRGLKSLSATVQLASKNEKAKDALKDMVEKIQNVISDAEHAMCMYTVERKKQTTSEAKCNRGFSGEIKSIIERVKKIKEDHAQAVKVLIYNTPITGTYVIELAYRLGEVVEENVSLLKEIKNQVEGLVGDIENFEALKKGWRSNDDSVLEEVRKQIQNVVMKAEDAICNYTVEKKKHKDEGWLIRYFKSPDYYSSIRDSAEEIKDIRYKIREIKEPIAAAVHHQVPTLITDTYDIQVADRLGQVVEESVSLLKEIENQVDSLVSYIKNLEAYLKLASGKTRSSDDDNCLKDVLDQLRNVVMEAEDAICKYTVEKKKKKKHKGCLRYFQSPASAKEIKAITERVKEIRESKAAKTLIHVHTQAHQPAIRLMVMAPVVEEIDVVGFDSEAKLIKDLLMKGPRDLTVITIEGMAGLGKTTLAKKIFKNHELHYDFGTCLWVYVSKGMNRRQIFLDILANFTKKIKQFKEISEELLAEKIKEYLKGWKYFIVVDDVWRERDWDFLRIAFPDNEKGSRVLLTTRLHNVASHAASSGNPHQLKFLSNDESWELLKKKVFRRERCPPQLEATGKSIASKCNGLPLAVVVIAEVLHNYMTDNEWKVIAEDPFPIINRQRLSYNELVRLSYDHLQPYNLQDCFLYLAVYPTGHEIAAWKLIRLWISEGFIPQIDGGNSSELEVTAEKYLKELVDNNLLMVMKRRADGQIKTCRIIHDTLHVFCKTQAASKNMFHEMNGARFELNKTPRRLCVHSSIIEFLRSETKPSGEHVRSFLSSCPNEIEIPTEHLAVIPKSFPLLRVLDIESFKLKSLPKQLYHLYHLRYLAVSTDLRCLPQGFNKFENMQTLVFNTSQDSLEVEADIWSLTKLRHVCTNNCMQLPLPSSNTGSTAIQTLSFISPSSCTAEILGKTPNLQKLGIRGNIVELMHMESKEGRNSPSFENLGKLIRLDNLKLLNNGGRPGELLNNVPQHIMFPQSLRKLTLSNMWLKWKNMRILGALDELEVLKLKEHSFMGESWELSDKDTIFKQLQFLMIGRTDLVEWKTSASCFPKLESSSLRTALTSAKSHPSLLSYPTLSRWNYIAQMKGLQIRL